MTADATVLSNRRLHARFDSASGNLRGLAFDADAPSLITGVTCWHLRGTIRTSEDPVPGEAAFRVLNVSLGPRVVEATLASDSVEIHRRFELGPRDALLRVRYRIRPLAGVPALDRGVFPHIEFAPDFADAFEDQRDCYSDGAELGDGRELPCWRVFFRDGRDEGLILATGCKRMMGHVLIQSRGMDVLPHVMVNYSTNYELPTSPIVFGGRLRQGLEVAFELGAWSRRRHAAIVRAARLSVPRDVRNRPPRGRPGPRPPGRLYYAHRLASPRQASRTFRCDRWLITRVPWAQLGWALVAGTGVRPPALVLRPRLTGEHRLFVGVGNSHGVKLRIEGQPEPIFRLASFTGMKKNPRGAFHLMLSGRHTAVEVDCGVIRLNGQAIRIERFPDTHQVAMIDYVRFEAVPGATSAARPRKSGRSMGRELDRGRVPAGFLLAGMADAPDLSPLLDPIKPDADAVRSVIWEHARRGFDKIYWRIDGQCSDYPSRVNTMRYVSAKVHGMFYAPAKAYGRLLRKVDLLRTVIRAGRRHGVGIWGWMRFNSYAGNVQSDFFKQHPEYHEVGENGHKAAKLCLAFPEVRQHKIDILVEAAGYGLEGLNLGFLRHAPVLHRHPVLVEGYRQRYGEDPPLPVASDHDLTHRFSLPPQDEPQVRWHRYRASFLTQFGRELRERLRENGLGHVKVSLWLRPQHALFDGIDLDDWLREGLCDEVVASARTPADEALPVAEPDTRWRQAVCARATLLRGVWVHDPAWIKRNLERLVSQGYAGISIYGSNIAVLDPHFLELLERIRTVSHGRRASRR